MTKRKEIIEHTFPVLGRIEVPLHHESAELLRALNGLPFSGPDHWQSLDHLGELRSVLKCGHHSRYEYLVLQLYLTHILKAEARVYGLSTSIDLARGGVEVSSAEELIKCWALLEEFGHLRGTYETERFLLRVLSTGPEIAGQFKGLFNDHRAVEFANKVIEDEDVWSLHRAIAWLSLDTFKSRKEHAHLSGSLEMAIEMLDALVSPTDDESLHRTRRYFASIRRVAHMYLDLANLPTFVHFHPSLLLQTILKSPDFFLEESNDATNRLISGILDYLQDEIYSSPRANKYKFERLEQLSLDFRNEDKGNRLAEGQDDLAQWILDAKGVSFWPHTKPNIQREHRLRLRLVSDGHFSPDEVKTVTASSKFDHIVQSERWSCIVTSYHGPLGHSCLFDLYELGDNGQILNGRVIEGVLSFLQERYTAQPRNSEVFNSLCDVPRSELIQYILGAIVGGMSGTAKDPTRIRFDKLRSFSKYTVGLGERDCNRESWLNSITARVATSNLTRDRKWEIDCLKKEIGLAPGGLCWR